MHDAVPMEVTNLQLISKSSIFPYTFFFMPLALVAIHPPSVLELDQISFCFFSIGTLVSLFFFLPEFIGIWLVTKAQSLGAQLLFYVLASSSCFDACKHVLCISASSTMERMRRRDEGCLPTSLCSYLACLETRWCAFL